MSGKTFVEEEHPRADNGQFTKKGSNNEKKLFSYSKTSINNNFNNGDEKDYSKIKEEYENAVDNDLLNFINSCINNPNPKATKVIGKPTQRHINDIKRLTGINTSDFDIVLDENLLRHILNGHGKNGASDNSMADIKHLARVGYIMKNYDDIDLAYHKNGKRVYSLHYRDSNNSQAPVLVMYKRINGYYVVSEAIVDCKRKKIAIETAFQPKK